MKTVEFNGQKFDAPDWTRVVTLDDFGTVVAWEQPPKRNGQQYAEVFPCKQQPIGFVRHYERYKEVR